MKSKKAKSLTTTTIPSEFTMTMNRPVTFATAELMDYNNRSEGDDAGIRRETSVVVLEE
jgi:hypothetical protein